MSMYGYSPEKIAKKAEKRHMSGVEYLDYLARKAPERGRRSTIAKQALTKLYGKKPRKIRPLTFR